MSSSFAGLEVVRGGGVFEANAGISIIDQYTSGLRVCSPTFLQEPGTVRTARWIPYGSVVKSILTMQCMGNTNYQDIEALSSQELFTTSIGCEMSPETLRQKLDQMANNPALLNEIDKAVVEVLKGAVFQTETVMGVKYYMLDIDVSPLINPGVHKEGISCTYKLAEGYAPIFAYLSHFAICFDLRVGKQHSEDGAIDFLKRCMNIVEQLGIDPSQVIVRVDSGHDDYLFREAAEFIGMYFIAKRNFRRSSTTSIVVTAKKNVEGVLSHDGCTMKYRYALPSGNDNEPGTVSVFEVRDPIFDKKAGVDMFALLRIADPNNPLFGCEGVKYDVLGWYTNLPLPSDAEDPFGVTFADAIIASYKAHATSEQYHSEVKTDMHMELLPSHYFATNKAFLALSAIAFNILRLIGDKALRVDSTSSLQHHKNSPIKRIRHATVIRTFINVPCQFIRHARRLILKLGKASPVFFTFEKLLA